ncbi:MAG: hypothetical protein JSR82_07550 [Verrucomicrobia bacterium]|nr:hypothetical protein [Verrucomicrobiota bacterium]
MQTQPPEALASDLANSIEGAEKLIRFSARNAVAPKDLSEADLQALIGRIIGVRDRLRHNALGETDEADFYKDLRLLTIAFAPVSIASVHDCVDTSDTHGKKMFWLFGGRISRANAALRNLSTLTFVALLLLLYAQIHWLVGSTLLERGARAESEKVTALKYPDETKPTGLASPGPDSSPSANPDLANGAQEQPTQVVGTASSARFQQAQLTGEAVHRMLESWWRGLILVPRFFEEPAREALAPKSAPNEVKGGETRKVHARMVIDILQAYLLPLLYGFVGAGCYVLRQIILETRLRTYRSETEMAYRVRLFLGMLAGIAIGWFLRPDASTTALPDAKTFANLTPFALAFLSGYSVELLFSAMDRMVQAFGATSKDSPS